MCTSSSSLQSVPFSSSPSHMGSGSSHGTQTSSDNIGMLLALPEIVRIIFSLARENLSECATVNRRWKAIAYNDPKLQQEILPKDRCGVAEWMRYLKIIGPIIREPRIPFDFYKESDLKLMLVLDHLETEEKEIIETADLMNLENVFQNPREGKAIGFHPYNTGIGLAQSSSKPLDEQCSYSERTHWVAYNPKAVGYGENLEAQEKLARETIRGAHISGLVDTVVIYLMEKLRSEISPFTTKELTRIRAVVKANGCPRSVRCAANTIYIHSIEGRAFENVAVIVARKSFGYPVNHSHIARF